MAGAEASAKRVVAADDDPLHGALIDHLDPTETVLFALARALEARSPYMQGHAERVALYALALADRIGLGPDDHETLRKGSLLHDIGKISLPDAILDKPAELTVQEYTVVKEHPVVGARIVEPLWSLRRALPLIRWHHERLDGRGYPDRLFGRDIPKLVRILSIADVYDSLVSERPYRGPLPTATCLDMLRRGAHDGQFDPDLVDAFCAIV